MKTRRYNKTHKPREVITWSRLYYDRKQWVIKYAWMYRDDENKLCWCTVTSSIYSPSETSAMATAQRMADTGGTLALPQLYNRQRVTEEELSVCAKYEIDIPEPKPEQGGI